MKPITKSAKIYAVFESVIQVKDCTPDELHDYLHKGRFGGQTTVNYHQGGITNIVTKEIIPLTAEEVEFVLRRRQA